MVNMLMLNTGISHLQFSSFRNYPQLQMDLYSPLVIIIGDNGVGKTNILEALSFLSPGKGLRSAKLSHISTFSDASTPCWTVAANLKDNEFDTILGTGLEYTHNGSEKRRLKINGFPARNQSEFAEHLNVIWIVPAMARLFQEGGSIRRKFIDRMAYAFDPNHVNRLHRYEHYLRERSTLLREGRRDISWLDSLEKSLAEDGIAIAHARAEVVRTLTEHQPNDPLSPFPRFFAQMQGDVEEWCRQMPAVAAEEKLRLAFLANRVQDTHTGGSASGPHRSDLLVNHLSKQIPAELCSTGEQKILLIALILAFAKAQMRSNERVTLLLLDDVVAHLDKHHQQYLFQELCQMITNGAKLQTWMTGTSLQDFTSLKQCAQYIRIKNTTLYDGYDDNDS